MTKVAAAPKKKLKTTTNLIIIDASGSMESKKDSVVTGLSELLTQIKKDAIKDKKTRKTATIVVDFSGPKDFNVLVEDSTSLKLEDNISKNYTTRGSTALFDAIDRAFNMVGKKEKSVFVSILTDGEENASLECSHDRVKKLIEEKKDLGWAITFVGTTESAIKAAQGIGISRGNTMVFADNSKGIYTGTQTLNNARAAYHAYNTGNDTVDLVSLAQAVSCDMTSLKSRISAVGMDNLLQDVSELTEKYNVKGVKLEGKLPDSSGGAEDSK